MGVSWMLLTLCPGSKMYRYEMKFSKVFFFLIGFIESDHLVYI